MHRLADVIGEVDGADLADGGDLPITDLAYDSRSVEPGALFFCVPGLKSDGHRFAPQAVERGAAALVVEHPLGLGVPEVVVDSARAAMAQAAKRFWGHPTEDLDVVGITGTNGKTTTAFVLRELLHGSGRACGLLSTVEMIVGGETSTVERTTPEAIDLQRSFRAMLDAGDSACAMEVSSHALSLHRVDGTHFAGAVYTNLSRDHFDFHGDIEDYFNAKRRLFTLEPGFSAINIDDAYGRRLAEEFSDAVTYGTAPGADYRAVAIEHSLTGARFSVEGPGGLIIDAESPLAGPFNALNALAAIVAAHMLGVDAESIAGTLPRVRPVPGRLESIDEGQPFSVLVDYAHNPDSLALVLRILRAQTDGRLICVFGATGDRDRGKRPQMGRIAGELADDAIVTTDDPFNEDPDTILEDIMSGADDHVLRIDDRREAFMRAIEGARPGDTVLIAGRGHHDEQVHAGGRTTPFHDPSVAREVLREIGWSRG